MTADDATDINVFFK